MHRDWVKGGGSAKGNFCMDSTLENRTIASLTPVAGFRRYAAPSELGHHLPNSPSAAPRCAERLPLAIASPRLRRSRIKQLLNSNQLHFQIEFAKNKSPWGFEQKPSERS